MFCFFVAVLGFYLMLIVRLEKDRIRKVFFRISLLVQMKPADSAARNCGKETTLKLFLLLGRKSFRIKKKKLYASPVRV